MRAIEITNIWLRKLNNKQPLWLLLSKELTGLVQ